MPELFELLTTGAGDLDAKRADSTVSLESELADPRQMEHQTLLAQLLQQPAMFNEVRKITSGIYFFELSIQKNIRQT